MGGAKLGVEDGSFESPGLTPAGNRFFITDGDTFVTAWTHVASAGNGNGTVDFYSNNAAWGINADNGSNYIGFGGSGRRVSTTLRHSHAEISEYCRVSFVVC